MKTCERAEVQLHSRKTGVCFKPRPLYFRGRDPGTHCTEGCQISKVGLDAVMSKKISSHTRNQTSIPLSSTHSPVAILSYSEVPSKRTIYFSSRSVYTTKVTTAGKYMMLTRHPRRVGQEKEVPVNQLVPFSSSVHLHSVFITTLFFIQSKCPLT
jgi:hypothetical protein